MIDLSTILVPVDLSPGSQLVVDYAMAIAHTVHATATLLHVCERADSMSGIVPGADRAVDDADNRATAREGLDALRAEAQRHTDTPIEVLVVDGSPAHEILAVARSFQMVVMGSHGRRGLQRVLMGSVAEAVVRKATCPVLTVHLPPPVRR